METASPSYREDLLPVLSEMLTHIPGVSAGKSFGLPGYRIGKKYFAFVGGDGVAIKLPPERVEALRARPEATDFRPMGGPVMKGWILIAHADPAAYQQETELFDEAIAYVAGQVK